MHIFARHWGIFDVYKMFELTKDIKSEILPTSEVFHSLDSPCWDTFDDEDGIYHIFTPNELIEKKSVHSTEHWMRIMNADLTYPILVLDQTQGPKELLNPTTPIEFQNQIPAKYDVLDGMHRLSKAKLMSKEYILVKVIPWDLIQQARVTDGFFWYTGRITGLITRGITGSYFLNDLPSAII